MRLFATLSAVFTLFLGGCAIVGPQMVRVEQAGADELLSYYHRMSSATLEVQKREFAEVGAAHDRAPDNDTRLQLSLMLLLPGVPWRDDVRAAQLLSGINYSDSLVSSSRRDLVVLLENLVQARRDDHRKCEQRLDGLRDERRKLEQKLDNTREECKRADMLQQKLDELRDIDRDLRSKRPSRRTKP